MKLNKIIAIASLGVVGFAAYKVATQLKKLSEPKEVEEVIEEPIEEKAISKTDKKIYTVCGAVLVAGSLVIVYNIGKLKGVKEARDVLIPRAEEFIHQAFGDGVKKGFGAATYSHLTNSLNDKFGDNTASFTFGNKEHGHGMGIHYDDAKVNSEDIMNIYTAIKDSFNAPISAAREA